jgi:hypothetical protein
MKGKKFKKLLEKQQNILEKIIDKENKLNYEEVEVKIQGHTANIEAERFVFSNSFMDQQAFRDDGSFILKEVFNNDQSFEREFGQNWYECNDLDELSIYTIEQMIAENEEYIDDYRVMVEFKQAYVDSYKELT